MCVHMCALCIVVGDNAHLEDKVPFKCLNRVLGRLLKKKMKKMDDKSSLANLLCAHVRPGPRWCTSQSRSVLHAPAFIMTIKKLTIPVSDVLQEIRMLNGSLSKLSSGSSYWYVSHTSTVSFLSVQYSIVFSCNYFTYSFTCTNRHILLSAWFAQGYRSLGIDKYTQNH